MKLVLDKPKYLSDSLSIIASLVNEARLKVKSDGISIISMDLAGICMVSFKMLKSAFSQYEVGEDIGINISNLFSIIKKYKEGDILTLEIIEDGRLVISLKGKTNKRFKMGTLQLDELADKDVPTLEHDASIKLKTSDFNESIEVCEVACDSEGSVIIEASDKLTLNLLLHLKWLLTT
jgi:proliferating cell nuclear antigen